MKIVKQKEKHNQFNIENLTLARVLSIITALDYCKQKGLTTKAGTQLIDALYGQMDKLKLGKDSQTKK